MRDKEFEHQLREYMREELKTEASLMHLQETARVSAEAWDGRRKANRAGKGAVMLWFTRYEGWRIWGFQLLGSAVSLMVMWAVLGGDFRGVVGRNGAVILAFCAVWVAGFGLPVFWRSERCGMGEIEMACRFSARVVTAARLVCVGVGDVVSLGVIYLFVVIRTGGVSAQLLGYMLLPFLAASCGCLLLLRLRARLSAGTLCYGFCFLLAAAVLCLYGLFPAAYGAAFAGLWGVGCVVLGIVLVNLVHRMLRGENDFGLNLA